MMSLTLSGHPRVPFVAHAAVPKKNATVVTGMGRKHKLQEQSSGEKRWVKHSENLCEKLKIDLLKDIHSVNLRLLGLKYTTFNSSRSLSLHLGHLRLVLHSKTGSDQQNMTLPRDSVFFLSTRRLPLFPSSRKIRTLRFGEKSIRRKLERFFFGWGARWAQKAVANGVK